MISVFLGFVSFVSKHFLFFYVEGIYSENFTRKKFIPSTVRHRGMGTSQMGTILRFASVPLRKMGTDLLGSWWP